jgi:DNA repair exonuclease SbcCD ATPase subunit
MAKKTGFEDLFSEDFGKLGIERLSQLILLSKELKESLKDAAVTLSKDVKSGKVGGGDDVQKFAQQKAQAKVIVEQFTAAERKELDLNKQLIESRKQSAVEIEKLRAQIKAQTQANKEAAGQFTNVSTKIRENTKALFAMAEAGKRNTKEFKDLLKETARMKDEIGDLKAEINLLGDETKTIQGVVGTLNLMAAGFQVAEGASALLGVESEELQKTFVKLQALMAVTNGLEQIGNLLKKESAAMLFLQSVQTKAAAAATNLYTFATGGATVATKAFRIALLATGIGAIIVLVAALAGAFDDVSESTDLATESQEDYNKAIDEYNANLDKTIERAKLMAAGARGSQEDLKRGIAILKAKGATDKEVYEAEQNLRKKELADLKTALDAKIQYYKGAFYVTNEFLSLTEEIRNKENEIEVSRLEAEKKRNEERKKLKADRIKSEEDEINEKIKIWDEELKAADEEFDAEFKRKSDELEMTSMALEAETDAISKNIDEQDRLKKEQEEKDKARFERQKALAIKAAQELSAFTQSQLQEKLSAIDSEVDASKRREDGLKKLAQQGSLNAQDSIALEKKRQAELENSREKAIKKQREQALILAGIEAFISLARSGSTNPSGQATGQVSDLLNGIKGSLDKLKAFKKGGKIEGGEQIVRVNEEGQEFVVSAPAVEKYGDGMLDDINSGKFDPINYISTPSSSRVNYVSDSTDVINELKGLREEVRNKPVSSFDVSPITKSIRENIRIGNDLLRRHYKRGDKLF